MSETIRLTILPEDIKAAIKAKEQGGILRSVFCPISQAARRQFQQEACTGASEVKVGAWYQSTTYLLDSTTYLLDAKGITLRQTFDYFLDRRDYDQLEAMAATTILLTKED